MKHLKLFGLPLAIAAFFLVQGHAHAATITVSGGCSVNNAITSSNDDSATGGCTAGSGTDVINIPAGTWTLTASTAINATTIIQGAGMGQTIIDGDNTFGAFLCSASSGQFDMQVNDLTIQNNGSTPAIAASSCNLDVENVEIKDSVFGSNSAVSADENNEANYTVIVNGLYVHDNDFDGANGLAVFIGGGPSVTMGVDFSVDNYTFTNNTTGANPTAAIAARAGGGLSDTINATIRNSTLSNVVSGKYMGMFFFAQTTASGASAVANVTVQNVTIARNLSTLTPPYGASGILGIAYAAPGSSATTAYSLQNNLFADNTINSTSANCQVMPFGAGGTETTTISSLGNNVADDSTCGLTGTNDQQGLAGLAATLDTLALNGGTIPTIALLDGSPAVDAGATISGLTTDQRGIARPLGNAYDAGAFESVLTASAPGSGGGSGSESGSGSGSGSNNANSAGGGSLAITGATSPVIVLLLSMLTSSVIALVIRNRRQHRISLR